MNEFRSIGFTDMLSKQGNGISGTREMEFFNGIHFSRGRKENEGILDNRSFSKKKKKTEVLENCDNLQ